MEHCIATEEVTILTDSEAVYIVTVTRVAMKVKHVFICVCYTIYKE
jgi:hypothetical protein